MTKRPTTFDYWFRILKTYIFPLFYPSKCREVGLLDPADRALALSLPPLLLLPHMRTTLYLTRFFAPL